MKTVQKMVLALAVSLLVLPGAFSDQKENGLVGKIVNGLVESTRTIHEINKENFAAVKADSKADFKEATARDPVFEQLRLTKGLGNKIKVIAENIKAGARENSEKEKIRRAEIQSHESYKALLEGQKDKAE